MLVQQRALSTVPSSMCLEDKALGRHPRLHSGRTNCRKPFDILSSERRGAARASAPVNASLFSQAWQQLMNRFSTGRRGHSVRTRQPRQLSGSGGLTPFSYASTLYQKGGCGVKAIGGYSRRLRAISQRFGASARLCAEAGAGGRGRPRARTVVRACGQFSRGDSGRACRAGPARACPGRAGGRDRRNHTSRRNGASSAKRPRADQGQEGLRCRMGAGGAWGYAR
jgi:hypothetical protein